MSFGPDIDELAELEPVKLKFVELWAKYPDRSANEVAESAFRMCGQEPGFRFAQYAQLWGSDLDVLEARDAARLTARAAQMGVPTKEQLIAEQLEIARDPRVDAKDRNTAYRNAMEGLGYITKQVSKETGPKIATPPAILFRAVDFDHEPDSGTEAEEAVA